MTSWRAVEANEPEFAHRVQQLFGSGRHKTLATLRRDGSPRISGIECDFLDGELRFASMAGARKLDDLRRDPRLAIHGPTVSPEIGRESHWPGEAKIHGRAVPALVAAATDDDSPDGVAFTVDVEEVVITRLNEEANKLVVESWTPRHGLRVFERD